MEVRLRTVTFLQLVLLGLNHFLQSFGALGSHPAEIRFIPPLFKCPWAQWGQEGLRGAMDTPERMRREERSHGHPRGDQEGGEEPWTPQRIPMDLSQAEGAWGGGGRTDEVK